MTIVRSALGAVSVATPKPREGGAQPPIWPLIVGNNGAFMAVRSSPAQGACGVSGYPCTHPGVDVNGPQGTPVHAPEDGVVVLAADGSVPPWRGYGPWLVVIRGRASGKFHLLSHLDPSARALAAIGLPVRAGDVVGRVSAARHTHWELRKALTPPSGGSNKTNNEDPIAWLQAARTGSTLVWMTLGGGLMLLAALYLKRR